MDNYTTINVTAADLKWLIGQAGNGLAFTGKKMTDRVALISRMGIALEGFPEMEEDEDDV